MIEFTRIKTPDKCCVVGCHRSHRRRKALNTNYKVCDYHFHIIYDNVRNRAIINEREIRYISLPESMQYIVYDNDLSFSEKLSKALGEHTPSSSGVVGDW